MKPLGWLYLAASLVVTLGIATGTAWIHQLLIKRLTFALFRLYAAGVSAGIGSVFGLALAWWMLANTSVTQSGPLWGFAIITLSTICVLVASFAYLAYKNAQLLRGEPPRSFTWITPDEYAGS